MRILVILSTACLELATCSRQEDAPASGADGAAGWATTRDALVEDYLKAQPAFAVYQGRHEFDGRLPDFNLGSAGGASCNPARQQAVEAVLRAQADYSWIANGRFKGGYITRHYATPAEGIDALQLELAQANYMDEDSFEYDERVADRTQKLIRKLLEAALA